MDYSEVVERIRQQLLGMDGKDLADLYNREFAEEDERLTYNGDGNFNLVDGQEPKNEIFDDAVKGLTEYYPELANPKSLTISGSV